MNTFSEGFCQELEKQAVNPGGAINAIKKLPPDAKQALLGALGGLGAGVGISGGLGVAGYRGEKAGKTGGLGRFARKHPLLTSGVAPTYNLGRLSAQAAKMKNNQ